MAVVCLSVRLFVCPVPDSKSRMEGHSKLIIGRKEAYDTGTYDPLTGWKVNSKVMVTSPLNAMTENQPYLLNGKAHELHTWSTMTRTIDMRGDVKGRRTRL